ncbi:hypothetical protein CAEBREN_14622 [Caenorhabditis brenneri]|uniref:GH18 domain-containing protein n=1 Tax=Caenorhabditis brenneri TaxID=135651 RepID=G0M998_CAEBE|nr:hypothetical protein CAEBREN_14622 [Caenorhabditis brenneri]
MIRILLLALSVFSLVSSTENLGKISVLPKGSTAEVLIDQLKNQPDLITKESILANYENMTPDEPPLFTNITQLVFLSDYAPRGNYYAEKNAKRINYVSFTHFIVVPKFDEYEMKMDNVRVVGTKLINQTLIQNLRKANPNIKIVPRFACSKFTPDIVKMFVKTEWLVQRSAQTIANYCREHGFDGVVFDCPTLLSKGIIAEERFFEDIHAVDLYRNMLETLEQVGNVIRKNGLIAIFSMEPPVHLISLESEIFLLPPQFSRSVMNAYDFVHIWTDGNSNRPMNHQYSHDRFLEKIMKFFHYSPKLLVGFTFFGHKIPLDEYRKGGSEKKWELIEYRSYLKVLKKDDAVLTFNEVNKEHELTSE